MDPPQVDYQAATEEVRIAVASLFGGMIRLLWKPVTTGTPSARFFKSMWMLAASVSCGFYGGPAFVRWFGLDYADTELVAAIMGLIGLSLAGSLLRAADNFDFRDWFRTLTEKGRK